MTNHVHLLFQVGHADTLPEVMHWLSTSFVRRFNKATSRCGHLWQGRYRSTIIEQATYLLRCMAYVDLNPVRAAMVAAAGDYPWCGHRALSRGGEGVLDLHELYLDLGGDEVSRYRTYLDLLAEEARRPAFSLARVHFVGNSRFVARMEARFGVESGRRVRRIVVSRGVVASVSHQGKPAQSL